MPRIKLSVEPNLSARLSAFSYQSEAVEAIKNLEYAAVFFEQGLGKTKIAVDLMLYWLEKKLIDTVLYVTKKSLLHNSEKEFGIHTFIKPRILSENKAANYFVFNTPSRLVLTHYEVLKTENYRLKLFLQARDVAVILDESLKIKNPDSSLTQSVCSLALLFKKRVIMTGTPVGNRPYDIWSQIYFLDQGKSLGSTFEEFKKNTDLVSSLYIDLNARNLFEKELESIYSKISTFTVRKTKESGIIHLPKKEIHRILVDWERHQYDLYRQIREEMKAIIIKEGVLTEDNSEQILKRLIRLVEIASNPALVDESYSSIPGKFDVTNDLIEKIIGSGEKCIVWTSFIENAIWLAGELKHFGTATVYGKLDISSRNKEIDRFLSDQKCKVLIATPGAAKEGLTLTTANHAIFYDRSFSLDDYLQAQDRIHRISQQKKCFVYNLIMKDSIDEWIDVLLEAKKLAAQLTQGDISLEYYKSQATYEFSEIIKTILGVTESRE